MLPPSAHPQVTHPVGRYNTETLGKVKMKAEALAKEKTEKVPIQWGTSLALSLLGWGTLGGGINAVLNVAGYFANDTKYMSLIANWIAWVAVLFFATGWVMAHSIEIALLQKRLRMARFLIFSLLVGIGLITLGLNNLVTHPVFHKMLDYMFLPLVLSGYFFRWSLFHKEPLWLLPGIIFGEKLKS